MIGAGAIGLPLHFGKAPKFLLERMGNMGEAVVESIIQNYGKSEVLTRMSDPNWFQCLGATMGMQWNSSGVTATVLGSLKRRINPRANDLGLYILGGKGKASWQIPNQVGAVSKRHELDGKQLVRSSQLTRRIDGNAVQDGYDLYQQYFLLSDEGEWVSISQGMDRGAMRARRYHWHSPTVRSFSESPHTGIVGMKDQRILNFTDPQADMLRKHVTDLTKENPKHVMEAIREVELPQRHNVEKSDVNMKRLASVLNLAYHRDIEKFDDLVMMQGVGPRTLKSLAMAAEVIHGDASRFDDPARFSFAVGGKDGRPHPIDMKSLDETIEMLQDSVSKAKLGNKDQSAALRRLHKIAEKGENAGTPLDFLEDLIKYEWDHAEKGGAMTFMGPVIKGLTKPLMELQHLFWSDKK